MVWPRTSAIYHEREWEWDWEREIERDRKIKRDKAPPTVYPGSYSFLIDRLTAASNCMVWPRASSIYHKREERTGMWVRERER